MAAPARQEERDVVMQSLEQEECGFSFVDPRSSEDVLRDKAAKAAAILAPVCGDVALSVVASPVDRWRQRCRFSVAVHDDSGGGGRMNAVGFFLELDEKGAPIFITGSFPLASEAVDATTRLLGVHLSDFPDVLMGLRTVGIHGTRAGPPPDGDVVVSLFYDCQLGAQWHTSAEMLRERCGLRGVVGRAKGERVVRKLRIFSYIFDRRLCTPHVALCSASRSCTLLHDCMIACTCTGWPCST